jgi:hypothetical protein
MWGGYNVIDSDELSRFSRKEDLLGLSTYLEFQESDITDSKYNECLDKVKFIYDNSKSWTKMDVWDDAEKYFDMDNNQCVKYENFLVNHSKKLAIDLADYFYQSKAMTKNMEKYAIDPILVLSETGGGTQMAFFDGITEETTEELAGGWCGDLLQIVNSLPDGYSLINCCFAELMGKLNYCYCEFGSNKAGFLLKNDKENLLKAVLLNLRGKRGPVMRVKVKEKKDSVEFIPAPC